MCKLSLLFIELSLCNFGLSHVGHQTTKKLFFFFPSPNFVYSVIINQSRGTTVFWAERDKKNMWRNSPWKTEREEERRKKGSHRNSRANMNWVCVSIQSVRECTCVCVYGSLFTSHCV